MPEIINPLDQVDPISFCLDPSNWNDCITDTITITDGFNDYARDSGIVYMKWLAQILLLKKIAGL